MVTAPEEYAIAIQDIMVTIAAKLHAHQALSTIPSLVPV